MRTPRGVAFGAVGVWLALAGPPSAWADQLQCNEEKVATQAAERLKPGSLMVDFCSLCENPVRVVRIHRARVVRDCDFEVEVSGQVVAQSREVLSGGFRKGLTWKQEPTPYRKQIDLAYVYTAVKAGRFHWLGGQLGLKAQVKSPEVNLPSKLMEALQSPASPPAQP